MTWITTDNERRLRHWDRLFGTDRLPVKHAKPRRQCIPGNGEVLAYDLDVSRLHWMQVVRLADDIAKRSNGLTYDMAMSEIERGWPVVADGCYVIEEVAEETAVSSLRLWDRLRNWLARKRLGVINAA